MNIMPCLACLPSLRWEHPLFLREVLNPPEACVLAAHAQWPCYPETRGSCCSSKEYYPNKKSLYNPRIVTVVAFGPFRLYVWKTPSPGSDHVGHLRNARHASLAFPNSSMVNCLQIIAIRVPILCFRFQYGALGSILGAAMSANFI